MKNILLSASVLTLLLGCASAPQEPTREEILAGMKASFGERGMAKLDRLDQSTLQQECSAVAAKGKDLEKPDRARLEKAALDAIKPPVDGQYIGDWKAGEAVAQSGRGMQFSDAAGTVAGGNCYACHQMSKAEISFGNLGPTLQAYGRLRQVKFADGKPTAESMPIVTYTWGKLWNSHAYNACSNMPRFGDAGILSQKQLQDVMALLLHPESPVNQ
jgi:L-cysteine S-thiosulfotransferase